MRTTLGGKLLALLLGFGLLPVILTSLVGYVVSRDTILNQAHDALEALTQTQALHFGTELNRERLLLRTIAGQLPTSGAVARMAPEELSAILTRSLPDDGVFDGLRLTTDEGRVLAVVALRKTEPHWPAAAPSADWQSTSVMVHRDGGQVVAYLVVAPVGEPQATWLEGHVRRSDFRKVFEVPEHFLTGVESVVLGPDEQPVFGFHEHAEGELPALLEREADIGISAGRRRVGGALVSTSRIPGSDWTFATTIPVAVALEPLVSLRNRAVAGTLLLILLIVVTAIVLSRAVTTPLRELAKAASLLGQAGPFKPVPIHSTDEVGTLVASFNSMATAMALSREEVERLHARELERAQQLASVGELASGIAHEIRNPLTGIRGALELALRKIPTGDGSRPLLEEAQQQLTRIVGSTSQLLQYARPPALQVIGVDAGMLVDRAVVVAGPRASGAGVVLRVEPHPDPLELHVDSELIVQVLVNLLLNGIDATHAGGVVTVWTANHAPEAWIGVHDTGPGVDPEHRDDIFRPFFTTKHQGTGLGLSISRQIVDRHGGTLTLQHTPDGGSTFVIALPLNEKD